jgi:uncharacterized protein (DUF427 family)
MKRPVGQIEREILRWSRAPRSARIETPGPGQESVWDYPRPPRVEAVLEIVRVEFGGRVVAESGRALRVLETAAPPTYYLPLDEVDATRLERARGESYCEWKGHAVYWDLVVDERRSERAAWSYPDPYDEYAELRDRPAFFATRVDACSVGDEVVSPQPGGYYGGWITARVVGPFKGDLGSDEW